MVEILGRAGYEPIGAGSAREALNLLDTPELSLVVSDIVMPGLSGFELLDEVRARRPSLPVLLVTGSQPRTTSRRRWLTARRGSS